MFGDIALYDLSYGLVSDLNEEYKNLLKFSIILIEFGIGFNTYHI